MSRKFAAIFPVALLALSVCALGDGQAEPITIWHQFYFDKGVDYNRLGELGLTRTQFRREFVEEIAAMQALGAKPIDAAAVLLALDSHYLETLDRSAQGIEASFAAEFRSALVAQYEAANKPQQLIVTDGAYSAIGARNNSTPPDVDLVATGTWSNINGETVRVSVDFVMVGTGHLISFTAQGPVPSVAANIAFQLFDYFEKERFPQPANPLPNLEIRPALPGHTGRMGVPRDVAVRACESQGFRLPYAFEMDVIFGMGAYQKGGIRIDPGWYYHIADDPDHVWLAPGKVEPVRGTSLANFERRGYFYIMVKGTPAPKIQIVTALKSFLQSEYGKPEAARDALAMDAVRLLLCDLDTHRSDNDVARRSMGNELSRLGMTPLGYLKHRDIPRAVGLTPAMQYELDQLVGQSR